MERSSIGWEAAPVVERAIWNGGRERSGALERAGSGQELRDNGEMDQDEWPNQVPHAVRIDGSGVWSLRDSEPRSRRELRDPILDLSERLRQLLLTRLMRRSVELPLHLG
jgi:hypothetical protein